jgi:hypothetical protein
MAKNNIEIVRTFLEEGAKGNTEAARAVLDDNVEWIEPDVPGLWFAGKHHGAEQSLREVVMPTLDRVDDFGIAIEEFLDAGDDIVAIGKFFGKSKETGKKLDIPACFVCKVQDGKIIRFRAYHNTALWLEAIGQPIGGKMPKAA